MSVSVQESTTCFCQEAKELTPDGKDKELDKIIGECKTRIKNLN